MPLTPTLLLVPSVSAAQILRRRLAREKRALAAVSAMRPKDLAEKMAEAACHSLGLMAWQGGHGAMLSARLLAAHPELLKPGLPEAPVARSLARTLYDLRAGGIAPEAVRRLAERSQSPEDKTRLLAVARIYARFHAEIDAKFFDETRLFIEAEKAEAAFLNGTTVLFSPDLEPRPDEFRFLLSLAARFGARRIDGGEAKVPGGFPALADDAGIPTVAWAATVFAPVHRESNREITRITGALFEAPAGQGPGEGPSPVSWVTAPGEAGELRSIARLVLKAAREGTPFDEMAIALPQAKVYAPILVDVFTRAKIPFKLHPSLPLATGRIARSFLLLLGSRDFDRGALLEFLTFAPVPLAERTGEADPPHPSVFDQITRELKVVSGIDRFRTALGHFSREESKVSSSLSESHRSAKGRRVRAAQALLVLVEKLHASLAFTAGRLPLDQWSSRLLALCEEWIRPESDLERAEYQIVCETLEGIASLATVSSAITFDRVLSVIEAQFERKRRPLEERSRVGVHVGSPEALSGGRFRFLALLGLVEGRFPGIFRPDPFLLDPERKALVDDAAAPKPPRAVKQLSLFDEAPAPSRGFDLTTLPTTESRVAQIRRMFARTLRQAEETLVLSYPRADEQTGRERLPSLFLMAALQAYKAKAVSADDLQGVLTEAEDGRADLDLSIDLGERDTEVVARHGLQGISWLESDRPFLRAAHELSRGRTARRLSPYDGLVGLEGADPDPRLDPVKGGLAISASRIAAFGECGFRYFLRYVLRVEPAIEPEERRKLDPLEKGTLFHEVAERFLRERRDQGALPIRNTGEERARLLALGDERLEAWVEGSPPRLVLLWRAEKKVFLALLSDWLAREAESSRTKKTIPAHFEVSFGMPHRRSNTNEPHRELPVEIALDDGGVLKISGQIDRIDRIDARDGGGLVLRDYKTGKAPLDSDGSLFKGGRQLQIPFYILAAQEIFPGEKVVEAFLDYVNAGRQVAFSPAKATSATFRALLLRITDLMGHGVFMQEPSACTFCDFTAVCGPSPVLESRKRRRRIHDPLARRVSELKQFA